MLIIILVVIVWLSKEGTIIVDERTAVTNTVANLNQLSTYIFKFKTSTSLSKEAKIKIQFPNQFQSNLGIVQLQQSQCSLACSQQDRTITFQLTSILYSGQLMTLSIKDIMNPQNVGGTGNFIVQALEGSNVIDQLSIYPPLGIASATKSLDSTRVELKTGFKPNAGEVSKYIIYFKNHQLISKGSYIIIHIPISSGFVIASNPKCVSINMYGKIIKGTLVCTTVINTSTNLLSNIQITGISEDIPIGQEMAMSIEMINPSQQLQTDTFGIQIFRGQTQIIIDQKFSIAGVFIQPGIISNILLQPKNTNILATKSRVMEYSLTFRLKNGLSSSGCIKILFPQAFLIVGTSKKYHKVHLKAGIEDISNMNKVVIQVVQSSFENYILIKNFKSFTTVSQDIQMDIMMINPNQKGMTTPLQITSYTTIDQTIVVDQNLNKARSYIKNLPSSSLFSNLPSIQLIGGSTYTSDNSVVTMQIQISPTTVFPALGYIIINVPSQLTIVAASFNNPNSCRVCIKSVTCTYYPVQSCELLNSNTQIKMQYLQDKTISVSASDVFIEVVNVIQKPLLADILMIDINLYDTDGNRKLEFYSDYLELTPQTFQYADLQIIGNDCNQYGILQLTYELRDHNLDAGNLQQTVNDLQGQLLITFQGFTNIGLGTKMSQVVNDASNNQKMIPCSYVFGIYPISNNQLICQYQTSAASEPQILIYNFQKINKGNQFRIQIPGIQFSTDANSKIVVVAQKLQNRLVQVYNKQTHSSIQCSAVAVATANTLSISQYSNYYIQQKFYINIDVGLSSTINNPKYGVIVLPQFYDQGFINSQNYVSCEIALDGVNYSPLTCQQYQQIDWIFFSLSKFSSLTSTLKFKVNNLQWFRYRKTIADKLEFRIYGSNLGIQFQKQATNFVTPNYQTFKTSQIVVPQKVMNQVDNIYTFEFSIGCEIPGQSQFKIDFPTSFQLINSVPIPVVTYPEFQDYSSTDKLSHILTNQQIVINNIKKINKDSNFRVIIKGVKNPGISILTGFNAYFVYQSYMVVYQANIDTINLSNSYQKGTIIFNKIDSFPINANTQSNYQITFTPQHTLGAGGFIKIKFPQQQYKQLPQNLQCSLAGAINRFSNCNLQGQTISVQIADDYQSGQIIFGIRNIVNPDQGLTDAFVIQTFYDNQIIDDTDLSSSSDKQITIAVRSQSLNSLLLDFLPKNEAEKSSYTFKFLPTINIQNDYQIFIKFPDEYDRILGYNIKCIIKSGLIPVNDKCVISDRQILISGFGNYQVDANNPIEIQIINVINPNYQGNGIKTSQFAVGVLKIGENYFRNLNSEFGQLEILSAPAWIDLSALSADHYYSRLKAHYSLEFKLSRKLYKTSLGGFIFIDFPFNFDLPNKEKIDCDTNGNSFSQIIFCNITQNRVYINGHTKDYQDIVSLNLRSIMNPNLIGDIYPIGVRTYDSYNQIIVERSYFNLNPFQLTYSYVGPQIIINSDQSITVNQGRQSQNIEIKMTEPSKTNLTIQPVLPMKINVIPCNININIGEQKKHFVITVPMITPVGTYYIEWKTLNDLVPVYYTPIQKTTLNVVAAIVNTIKVDDILSIPNKGNSIPVRLIADKSPDIGVTVTVSTLKNYNGVKINGNTFSKLYLRPNEKEWNFTIIHDKNETDPFLGIGKVQLKLQGVNKDEYRLDKTELQFQISTQDNVPPVITSASVKNIQQNTADLDFAVNEPSIIYIQLSLKQTIVPTFEQVKNKTEVQKSTETQFIKFIARDTNTKTIQLKNLKAQQIYTIFIYAEDRGWNVNQQVNTVELVTSNRYKPCKFNLRFNKISLSIYEQETLKNRLNYILSQGYSQNTVEIKNGSDSLVNGQNNVTSELEISFSANPYSSIAPSPENLLSILKDQRLEQLLLANIVFYASSQSNLNQFTLFPDDIPIYMNQPVFYSKATSNVVLKFKSNKEGVLFGLAIQESKDLGNKTKPKLPSSFQVYKGMDQHNNRWNYSFHAQSKFKANQDSYLQFQGLASHTYYNLYIVQGGNQPGYPILDSNGQVKPIYSVLTSQYVEIVLLDINIGVISQLGLLLMGLTLVMFSL